MPQPKRTAERGAVRSVLVSTMRDRAQMEQVVPKHQSSGADAVILELEAGIVANHDVARELVGEVLAEADYGRMQRAVKVNPVGSSHLEKDLEAIAPGRPDAVLMTLVKDPSEVVYVDQRLAELEREYRLAPGELRIWILVERARGAIKLLDIAEASARVDLLCHGPADLTADLGTSISLEDEELGAQAGIELLYARSMVVYAARAAGALAIDTALTNTRSENLPHHVRVSRAMGYDGMVAISPRQIPTIMEAFTPSEPELEHARRAVELFHKGLVQGIGIANLDGEMISKSVYEGYIRVLERAGVHIETPWPEASHV